MMMRPSLLMAVLSLVVGPALAGCSKKDRNSCEYWVEKLAKGEHISDGVKKAGELQCTSALPALTALYEKGEMADETFEATLKVNDHEGALPLLRMALKSKDHGKEAAHIIGEWKLKSAKPELVGILTDDQYATLREPVLEALLSFEEPKAIEDVLIHVAGTDLNAQSYTVNKTAIEKLGEMKSTKATPTLIKMAFARSMKGQEVFRWVRRALAETGDPTLVDQLFAVLAGKNDAVREQVRLAGFDDWEWQTGPKIAQLLTDTLDARIAEPLAQNLAADLKRPVNPTPEQEQRWTIHQKNRLKFIMFALSHIGSDVPVETLAVVLRDRYKDTINQRVNAANALAFTGSEAAQDKLIDAFRKDQSEPFKAALLQIIALGLDDRKIGLWDDMINERPFPGEKPEPKPRRPKGAPPEEIPSEAVKAVLESNETLKTYLAFQRACTNDLACHLDKLKTGTRDEKVKALVNLARGRMGSTEDIRQVIFDTFKNAAKGDVDTRRFALIALTRLGDAKDGQKLVDLSKSMPEPPPPGARPAAPDPNKPEEDEAPDIYYKDEIWVMGHALTRRK